MGKIDYQYKKLLKKILKRGYTYEDPKRKDINRIEISDYKLKYDLSEGFPLLTTKKVHYKGIIAELLWFLNGDTNIKYLVDNGVNIWNKDAYNYYLQKVAQYNYSAIKRKDVSQPILSIKEFIENLDKIQWFKYPAYNGGDLGRVYGAQWKNWGDPYAEVNGFRNTVDQISNLIQGLKYNPMGTKHIVIAWNPAELDEMALPPCHWSFEILVEPIKLSERKRNVDVDGLLTKAVEKSKGLEGYLDNVGVPKYKFKLKWHQRSVDTFLGLPYNIASYATLAYIIGKATNMVPSHIIGDLSNVHIYEPHLDAVKKQLKNKSWTYESPSLEITGDGDKIEDFKINKYESFPKIKAEMIEYR